MRNDTRTGSAPAARPHRASLITITKRAAVPFWRALLIRVAAIFAALVAAGLVTIALTKDSPIKIYATMFEGAFGTSWATWKTLQDIAILLGISLAVTPAFRMKFWNTGAEGQVLIGCLACAATMYYLGGKVPEWLLMILMAAASLAAGALWGLLPAVFKSFWNTNETLFTLMMNYVSIQLIEFFLKVADKTGSNTVGPNLLSHGWYPQLFGKQYLLTIVVVAVLTLLIYFYLNYTKHGYEISVVGESENTAKYVGINVRRVVIRTMVLSGALYGLIGLLIVGATSHSIDSNIAGGRGFTAIMVSWLAKFNPLTMVLTSLLLVFLGRGAEEVTTQRGLNSSFSDIISGIILFFIIGCEFFINYKVHFNFGERTRSAVPAASGTDGGKEAK